MNAVKEIYEIPEVVDFYRKEKKLQPAEKVLFNRFSRELKEANLLDVGIGAGRTSLHLIDRVAGYTGIDYSQGMIDYCRKEFANSAAKFSCSDARYMPEFQDNQFDFIFFSYNGIDCVSLADRMLVLQEIYRILKPQGSFLFSSHNTQTYPSLKKWNLALNPLRTINNYKRAVYRKAQNDWQAIEGDPNHFTFKDYDYDGSIDLVYVKPTYQTKLLEKYGFDQIKYYAQSNGKALAANQLPTYREPWLYFYCKKV